MPSESAFQSEVLSQHAGLAKDIYKNPFCNPEHISHLEGIEGLRLKLGEGEPETEREKKRGSKFLEKVVGVLGRRGREACPSNQVMRAVRDHMENMTE